MKSIFSLFIIVLLSSNFVFASIVSLSDTTQKKSKKSEQKSDMVSIAVIETKFGKIEIELFEKDAPKTTANFIGLANQGYFNGIIFHRISKNFVIQGGDPTGTGSGGKSIYGGQFEDELNPNTPSYKEGYKRGVVAMANAGPNTNTSQFFIMLTDRPTMPKLYTIFGKVIKGMDVVDKIAEQPITPVMAPTDGKPVKDIVMKKVYIEKRKKASSSK